MPRSRPAPDHYSQKRLDELNVDPAAGEDVIIGSPTLHARRFPLQGYLGSYMSMNLERG